ncbi:unnamed protein product [Cladocopium goreaui]|uniref:Uncharacterized protein n=1 Tax=Cladocopium goreaui TaxID=2562237 RepID=A0A9P1CID2_9DINO|nr:unnamed protein product [Cladocopium goreaui]
MTPYQYRRHGLRCDDAMAAEMPGFSHCITRKPTLSGRQELATSISTPILTLSHIQGCVPLQKLAPQLRAPPKPVDMGHHGAAATTEAAYELGHGLRVMGLSKRPGYILIHNHSPTLKFLMLQEVLEYEVSKGRIHEDDIVIFSDGHDVLLQQSLAEIFVAYSRFPDWPYLISGERNCWPWPHTHPSHGTWDLNDQIPFANQSWTINRWIRFLPEDFCRMIRGDGPYPYPNIGLSMAPAKRFIEVLKRNNKIVLEEEMNDQGAMWLVIFRYAEELNIQIDQHAEVFLNMLEYKAGDLEREPCDKTWFRGAGGFGRPPRNALTNTTPGILHFNGPSHEDGVWPSCYHVINGKFRRKEHGHAFYDIDHDILADKGKKAGEDQHAFPEAEAPSHSLPPG